MLEIILPIIMQHAQFLGLGGFLMLFVFFILKQNYFPSLEKLLSPDIVIHFIDFCIIIGFISMVSGAVGTVLELQGVNVLVSSKEETGSESFKEDTYGVFIAPLVGEKAEDIKKGKNICNRMQKEVKKRLRSLKEKNVFVQKYVSEYDLVIDSHDVAREEGQKFGAEIMIWGTVKGKDVSVNLTIVNPFKDKFYQVFYKNIFYESALAHSQFLELTSMRFSTDPMVSLLLILKNYRDSRYQEALADLIKIVPLTNADTAFLNFYKANIACFIGNYEAALPLYDEVLKIFPDYPAVLNNKAMLYNIQGKHTDAMLELNESLNKNPYDYEAYLNRATVYLTKGIYDSAKQNYEITEQMIGENNNKESNKALVQYFSENYDLALEQYNKLIEKEPENTFYYNNRAFIYNAKGEMNKALEDMDKAISLKPKDFYLYINRSAIYFSNREFEQAMTNYDKLIEFYPEREEVYRKRGRVFYSIGDNEQALMDFNKAIEINENDYKAMTYRGQVYEKKQAEDQALKEYDKAIEINPEYELAYNNRGLLYDLRGEYNLAIYNFNKAININPDYVDAYNNRGTTYFQKENYDKAIKDFSTAILLNSNDPTLYINRGNAFRAIDEYNLAIIDFNKAIELKPDDISAYKNRGNLYFSQGRFEEAILDYQGAIELNPEDSDVYFNLALSYEQIGAIPEALDAYQSFIDTASSQLASYVEAAKQKIQQLKP